MNFWLRSDTFRESEEGILSKLVMLLGKPVNAQGIANITKRHIPAGDYVLIQVLPHGYVSGEYHWSAKCESNVSWYVTATLRKLVNALC